MLVNSRHIKNVPGHKTDKKDSEWIAKLLLSGLLKGSFVSLKKNQGIRCITQTSTKVSWTANG